MSGYILRPYLFLTLMPKIHHVFVMNCLIADLPLELCVFTFVFFLSFMAIIIRKDIAAVPWFFNFVC
jgi:hypothetical protein